MKHTLALVTTVGLITFCVLIYSINKGKPSVAFPRILSALTKHLPHRKENVNVLDIYAKNMKNESFFRIMKNRLTKADRKIQLYKKPRIQQNFTAKSPLSSRILSKKLPISHISFSGKASFF